MPTTVMALSDTDTTLQDHWTDRFMGNIVPEEVLQEAKAYSQHQGPRSPPSAALRARSTVTSTFPRMPIYSVQQVTEDVTRGSRHRPITNRMIEECVVLHAKWKYTSFEFRLLNVQQKEADIMGIIKPRMREVLQSWLPHYVRAYDLVELWERHGLLDADDGEGKGRDEDLVIRMPSVGYHGGLEMPGNLSTVCGMRF